MFNKELGYASTNTGPTSFLSSRTGQIPVSRACGRIVLNDQLKVTSC